MNNLKLKLSIILAILAIAVGVEAQSNTNAPPLPVFPFSFDQLTNLPSADTFQSASFGVGSGLILKRANVENNIKFDFYYKTNWMFSGEIQNGPVSTVIDAFSLHAGYRKAWASSEFYAQGGGRRNWVSDAGQKPSFQGLLDLGFAYRPFTGGRFMINPELRVLTPSHGSVFKGQGELEPALLMKLLL